MTDTPPLRTTHLVSALLARQRRWASGAGLEVEEDYLPTSRSNLFSLHPETEEEVRNGDGNEFGDADSPRRPKLAALRSSSALAMNFFDPWRGRDLTPLVVALGLGGTASTLRFEQKFKHGVGARWPNLDVVLFRENCEPLAIESKFTEPYPRYPRACSPLQPRYLNQDRWASKRLVRCEALAHRLGHDVTFRHLDGAQLLKHILGLSHCRPGLKPTLVYLWYSAASSEAAEHLEEVSAFSSYVGDEVHFVPLTYQDLFPRLQAHLEPAHRAYLAARYF